MADLYDDIYPAQIPYRKKNDPLVFQPPPREKGREGAVAGERFDKGDG